MNILAFIMRPLPSRLCLVGWLLVIVGLILSVFIIGMPILAIGWMILVYDKFYSWYKTLIPQKQRNQMAEKLKKEYEPYQPAIQSMKGIIIEILKTAGLIFVTGILIIMLGFKFNWWQGIK